MEAYRIAIGISLNNHVSSVLGLIARDFAKTDAAAVKLKKTLRSIELMGAAGAALGGAGFVGLKMLKDTLEPAREYAHQLNIMNMAGMKHVEVAQAIGDAWKTTGTVITTTATENLRSLLDLRNVLASQDRERYQGRPPAAGTAAYAAMSQADWQSARAALPLIAKMQAGMEAAEPGLYRKGAQGQDYAFAAAKALDIRGAAQDPGRFGDELQRMGQVGIWSQNRVTPKMFQSVLYYARQASMGLSPDFVYGVLPSLMLEQSTGKSSGGGGARGIGPAVAAEYREVIQGYINKKALPLLRDMGLVGAHSAVHTTTKGTTVGAMTGADLFAKNQFEWAQKILRPRMEQYMARHHVADTTQNELALLGQIFRGNQLAAWLAGQYIVKASNIQRDQELIAEAMRPDAAYALALKNDPELALRAANAQWTNLKTVIGNDILPIVIPAIHGLADALHDLTDWAQANPETFRGLIWAFAGLSGALLFSGTVLTLAAAFKGLKLLLWDMPGVVRKALAGSKAAETAAAAEAGGAGAAGARGAAVGASLASRIAGIVKGTTEAAVAGSVIQHMNNAPRGTYPAIDRLHDMAHRYDQKGGYSWDLPGTTPPGAAHKAASALKALGALPSNAASLPPPLSSSEIAAWALLGSNLGVGNTASRLWGRGRYRSPLDLTKTPTSEAGDRYRIWADNPFFGGMKDDTHISWMKPGGALAEPGGGAAGMIASLGSGIDSAVASLRQAAAAITATANRAISLTVHLDGTVVANGIALGRIMADSVARDMHGPSTGTLMQDPLNTFP